MPHSHLHLFVDISAHGLGHLAQVAPVLNQLPARLPQLQITLRSGLPADRLRQRIRPAFAHLATASDFGYVMRDAVTLDLPATAAAYRRAHADFPARVAAEAAQLQALGVDAVFSDVSYLPLAGAAAAGIPALALCSLNWADLFRHFFGQEDWAAPIHAEMLAAYRAAHFLRVTPAMPMHALTNVREVGPIFAPGRDRRHALREKVGAGETARLLMVGMGGVPLRLPVERWPRHPDIRYLVPAGWNVTRPDCMAIESFDWPFVDLLRSVDAVITKPGYGTFVEAAGNGTAVLYPRRADWPEQDCLIEWLQRHGRGKEIGADQLAAGDFDAALQSCLNIAPPPWDARDGAAEAAAILADRLIRPVRGAGAPVPGRSS